jgi:hypothetical protein
VPPRASVLWAAPLFSLDTDRRNRGVVSRRQGYQGTLIISRAGPG